MIDQDESWQVIKHTVKADGKVQDFIEDEVVLPSGGTMVRQYADHPGAVSIIAVDEHLRVAVVDQYRHPVRMRLIEPPAGLLDIAGEDPLLAAKRELAEEAQLAAETWAVLLDIFTSPGGLAEPIRVYLARDLKPAPRPEGFAVEDEEAEMSVHWIPLDELVESVYAGKIQSPTMVNGVLSLKLAIEQGRVGELRPADAPWGARDRLVARRAKEHER